MSATGIGHILFLNMPCIRLCFCSFVTLLRLLCCRGSANQQRKRYLPGRDRSTGYKTTNTDSYIFNYVIFAYFLFQEDRVQCRFQLPTGPCTHDTHKQVPLLFKRISPFLVTEFLSTYSKLLSNSLIFHHVSGSYHFIPNADLELRFALPKN